MATGRPQTSVGSSVWYQSASVSVGRQNSRRRRQRLQVVEAELKANPEGDDEGDVCRSSLLKTMRATMKANSRRNSRRTQKAERRRTQTIADERRRTQTKRNAEKRRRKTMTFRKSEGRFQNQRSADRSPTEDEATRERTISESEVGQQGGVARRQTMPGRASQEKKILALQVSVAERRRSRATQGSGDVTGSGDAREGVARQLSPLQNPL